MPRPAIEELDYRQTPLGELILRRRRVRSLGDADVYEVKLDGQFLMSSLVNSAEIELATIALAEAPGDQRDVLVGGLGLGHTAGAALDTPHVRSVTVVEYLQPVIDWHERRLVPLGDKLVSDPHCRLIHADFFRFISGDTSAPAKENSAPDEPDKFHAVLLDIDHSPQALLQPDHAAFYSAEGLARLAGRLHPGGVFALWSADPPEPDFLSDLERVFASVRVHESRFFHVLLNEENVNYIILARRTES